jgi:hypothetical protein
MPRMKLTKAQVARHQLGTALALFIEDLDSVAVHTLTSAGGEVAEHLTKKAGKQAFMSHALASFPDLDIKDARRLQRQFANAFKHATAKDGKERADQKLFARFDDRQNDHALFIAWHDYMLAVVVLPIEAQAFQVW